MYHRAVVLLLLVVVSLAQGNYLLTTKSQPNSCLTATTLANPGEVRFLPCSAANVSVQAWTTDASGHIYLVNYPKYALGLGVKAAANTKSTLGYDAKVVMIDFTVDTRATQTWKFVSSQGTGAVGYLDIRCGTFTDRVIWAPYTKTGSVDVNEVWVSTRTSGAFNHFFMQTPIPTPAPTLPPSSPPVTVSGSVQDSYGNSVAGLNVASQISSATTDANGLYIITVPSGISNITVSGNGYVTVIAVVNTATGPTVGNIVISAVLAPGVLRIVVQWSSEGDFDSVLFWGPYEATYSYFCGYYHVSGNCSTSTVNLDVDNTVAYGPETITITDLSKCSQGFDYSVAAFDVNVANTLTVTVYQGSSITNIFTRDGPQGADLPAYTSWTWNVFHLSPTGQITFNGAITGSDPI